MENLQTSQQHGVWATTYSPTKKLMHAFKNSDNVIMVFSLTESSSFQGIARMEGEPDPNFKPEFFQKK